MKLLWWWWSPRLAVVPHVPAENQSIGISKRTISIRMDSIVTGAAARLDASIAAKSLAASGGAPLQVAHVAVDAGANSRQSSLHQRRVAPRLNGPLVVRAGRGRRAPWVRVRRALAWALRVRVDPRQDPVDRRAARRCCSNVPNSAAATTKISPKCADCWLRSAGRKSTMRLWRRSVAVSPKKQALCRRRTSSSKRFGNPGAPTRARSVMPCGPTTGARGRVRPWARRPSRSLLHRRNQPRAAQAR
jgi:hypothetical protein